MTSAACDPRGPRLVLDGREWLLPEGEHVIGRDEAAAIRIDAAGVSRRHARLAVRGGQCTIEDLGSKNGTFCGAVRVDLPHRLENGAVIALGRHVRLVFRQGGAVETVSEFPTVPGAGQAVFRREGELWTAVFDREAARLTDVKGFPDLARLMAQPGVEIHCLELADRPAETAAPDAMLDDRAKREIRERARHLQEEIEEADARNDLGRAEAARAELDRIGELLSGALGLRGRPRGLKSEAERARTAVTWRLRSAIRKITAAHPRLGRHLQNAVRTGTFCVYMPETPIRWEL